MRSKSATYEQLRALRGKYNELWEKHHALLRQVAVSTRDRSGVLTLALFAMRSSGEAYAIADGEGVLFRNGRWLELERDRTRWSATARDPKAPASAPTLVHLATAAAERLIGRAATRHAVARYERPERDDVFDVRFERVSGRRVIGVAIRDVTRLVQAERAVAMSKRAVEEKRASAAQRNVMSGE